MTEAVLAFLAEVAVKSTLLILVAAGASWAARRGPAAVRHRIWCAALAGMAALPLVMLLVPRLGVPVLPAEAERMVASPSDRPDQTDGSEIAPLNTAPSPIEEHQGFPWGTVLITLYAAGVVGSTVGFALSLGRLRRVARLSGPAAVREIRALELVSGVLGIASPCLRVAGDGGPTVPMTWGAHRPVLLLPRSAEAWPEAYLRSALAHEAAHIRRGDWAVQLAVRVICVFYWFHPMARWAAARLRIEAERACDDLALLSGIHAADYAACLLEVTRMNREDRPDRQFALAALPMAQSTALAERLRAVVDADAQRQERRRGVGLVIALATLTAVLVTGALQATPARPSAAMTPDRGRATVKAVPKSKVSAQAQLSALRTRLTAAEAEVRRLRASEKSTGLSFYRLEAGKGAADSGQNPSQLAAALDQQRLELKQAQAEQEAAADALAGAQKLERTVEAQRDASEAKAQAQRAAALSAQIRALEALQGESVNRAKQDKDLQARREQYERAFRAQSKHDSRRAADAEREAKRNAELRRREADRGAETARRSKGTPSAQSGMGIGGEGLGSSLGGGGAAGVPGLSGMFGDGGSPPRGGEGLGGSLGPAGIGGMPGGLAPAARNSDDTRSMGGGSGRRPGAIASRIYDEQLEELQDQMRHIHLDISAAKRRYERAVQRTRVGIAPTEEAEDAELKLQHLELDLDSLLRKIKRLQASRKPPGGDAGGGRR